MHQDGNGRDGDLRVLLAGRPEWFETPQAAFDADISFVTTTTIHAAVQELDGTPPAFDCVVVDSTLQDADAPEFVSRLTDERADVPVVVAPGQGDGSERLASDVIAAGAESYVPAGETGEELLTSVRRAIECADERKRRQSHAARFEALFDDSETYRWVVDAAGVIVDANAAAADRFPDVDGPLWELSAFDSAVTAELQSAIDDALTGERVGVSTELPDGGSVELSFFPSDDGTVVVEAVDVTRRSRLEEELRRSERLHRITLNNMTDTVLVTDDEGRFTYVCPNVHFIFGYTAEEIHHLGTIDQLLGEDLFDESALSEAGVLTNVECTATDKVGEEHTLLVNVKEVSIQGGTRLYSCRDITTRKERERALSTVHDTARQMLSAESRVEAARSLAEDVVDGLPVDGAACYLFDSTDSVLRPMAVTSAFAESHGPLPALSPDTNTLVGRTFVRGDIAHFDDVRRSERLTNRTTDVRAAAFVPVGDHGVLVIGCDEQGGIDEVTVELADLFAATAEAGLDRIDRESALRERDETLQRRNVRLVELDRTNDIIREIDRALVRAETREEIDRAVCDRLTSAGRFALAWIGERTATGVEVRACAGTEQGYLDALPDTVDATAEPTYETMRTDEPRTVSNVAADPRGEEWRVEALSRGFQSVISVPLQYEGATYGTLTVYATEANAVDGPIDSVLVELGGTIASAIGSVRRRDALLGGTVTELVYGTTDEDCLLYDLAERTDSELVVAGGIERLDDRVLVFVTVERGSVESVARTAREFVAVDEARPITVDEDGGTLQLELSGPFIGTVLADHGAMLRRFAADPTDATLAVTVPASTDVRTVNEVVSGWYDRFELRSRQQRSDGRPTGQKIRSRLTDRLTDRQLEAARTAYHSGYFESPRETTGEEVAETLGVSPTAFYQLNRKAERKLYSFLFDGEGFDSEA
jgi:PAS domain S-box-containing protein